MISLPDRHVFGITDYAWGVSKDFTIQRTNQRGSTLNRTFAVPLLVLDISFVVLLITVTPLAQDVVSLLHITL